MNFEHMNAIQRRLHNAACVLGADGDEYGFEQLQRDAIAEIDRLKAHAVVLANTEREVERERCAKLCETWMEAAERESGPEAAGWLHQMAQHMRGLRA